VTHHAKTETGLSTLDFADRLNVNKSVHQKNKGRQGRHLLLANSMYNIP